MISVIIPLYNKAASIGLTLRAVLEQTFQDFEVVVVDDGSTDGGADVVRAVDDARIRLFSQPNAGVSAARNRGVSESRGEFVAFLDADDLWRPTYLETQFALTRKYPDCDVFATNYEFRDAEGCTSPTILRRLPFAGEDGILTNYFEVASCSHPPLWTSAVIVRREAVEAIGGFPVGIRSGEDLLTWARLAVRHSIAFSKLSLAVFVYDRTLFNNDQKTREPETDDCVGKELAKLYQNNPSILGLKSYNALWHKMRARIFLDKGQHKAARKECIKALRLRVTLRCIVFYLLTLLPLKMSQVLLHAHIS